jgi:hypothetical protein
MRKRGKPMSGADYLMGAAQTAIQQGRPYSQRFGDLLWLAFNVNAASDEMPLFIETFAQRPLEAHEAAPAVIVDTAVSVALERGDLAGAKEALMTGLKLFALWPEFLVVQDEHPSLTAKVVPPNE